MAEFIYTMKNVRKAHGDKVILDNVTMSFYPGAKIGVVGPNGAGKSSILKIMAGIDQPSNGEAFLDPGATVGILLQEPPLSEDKTVRRTSKSGMGDIMVKLKRYNEVAELMATDYSDELMEEMGSCRRPSTPPTPGTSTASSNRRWTPCAARPATRRSPTSGGERRRVALCKLLLSKPDLLLLDEPTNHLDAESVLWLEQFLANYPGAVLAVTHDRYFLDHVAQWICEVDRGKLHPYEGNYSTYLEKKAERLEVQGKKGPEAAEASRGRARLGAVGRQGSPDQEQGAPGPLRGDGRGGGEDAQARLRGDPDPDPAAVGRHRRRGEQPGQGLRRTRAHRDLSFSLPRNGIVGVIGPNGVGKTTLFKTIVGLEEPDSGNVKVGETVKLSHVDQTRANIDPKKTVKRSSPTASTTSRSVRMKCRRAPTSARSASRAPISRSRRRCFPAVSATASTLR